MLWKTKEGIIVYSNKENKGTSHFINGLYTGLCWQCVEFARRYLIITQGITFDSIPNAYQIFDLPYFKTLTGTPVFIQKCINGSATPPRLNSLLIWSSLISKQKTGHVAVVTDIGSHWIEITQQNEDEPVRRLQMKHNYGYPICKFDEPFLLGWINI